MSHPPSGARYNAALVVPMHNEAGHVARLLDEIVNATAGLGAVQIIVVDDASTDPTVQELETAQSRISNLKIVRHAQNCGQSQAIISGMLAAEAPWICTLDGDGQNDPADIAKLMAARDESASPQTTLFIGHRVRRDDNAKSKASKLANMIRAAILGDATPDSGCGLKLVHRDLFLSLPRFNALHRFMPALIIRAGGSVVSVPVTHRPRTYGRSHYGILGRGLIGIVDLMGVWWLMRRHKNPQVKP